MLAWLVDFEFRHLRLMLLEIVSEVPAKTPGSSEQTKT